jgi:hypothetical protein
MARNKLRDKARQQKTLRRGEGKAETGDLDALAAIPAHQSTPSQIVSEKELLKALNDKLSPDERYLAEQRKNGREWTDIAAEKGESAEALRKRYARAIDRVCGELGLEAVDHA